MLSSKRPALARTTTSLSQKNQNNVHHPNSQSLLKQAVKNKGSLLDKENSVPFTIHTPVKAAVTPSIKSNVTTSRKTTVLSKKPVQQNHTVKKAKTPLEKLKSAKSTVATRGGALRDITNQTPSANTTLSKKMGETIEKVVISSSVDATPDQENIEPEYMPPPRIEESECLATVDVDIDNLARLMQPKKASLDIDIEKDFELEEIPTLSYTPTLSDFGLEPISLQQKDASFWLSNSLLL